METAFVDQGQYFFRSNSLYVAGTTMPKKNLFCTKIFRWRSSQTPRTTIIIAMSSVPVALWNLKVPSGGVKVPGYDDEDGSPLPYRITMAAIDSATASDKPSTLKLHKRIVAVTAESDEEDEDEEIDDGESIEEEYVICTLWSGKVFSEFWVDLSL